MSAQRDPSLPRLPPELIQAIVYHLSPGILVGDIVTERTLAVLSCVSRLVRAWALDARYRTMVVPRHVRDFRKLYARLRGGVPPFPCAGYTKAVFVALDDVSRLTSSSAGWESELLRLLHYCGPTLEILSLWHSESRAVLRDTAQTRGKRKAGVLQPAWAWGEGEDVASDLAIEGDSDSDDAHTALSDRLPSDSPRWLRHELNTLPPAEFTKRHHAHVALRPLRQEQGRRHLKGGCRPRCLSIVFALPLFEHEDPDLFSRMTIWTRCEELDVFVPVVSHVGTALQLFSTLTRSPLRRLRISSVHATLLLALPPYSNSPRRTYYSGVDGAQAEEDSKPNLNLATCLSRLIRSSKMNGSVLNEFAGFHFDDIMALERALVAGAIDTTTAASISSSSEDAVRVRIIQGKQQAAWGKLKERHHDFMERSGGRLGAWKTLGA